MGVGEEGGGRGEEGTKNGDMWGGVGGFVGKGRKRRGKGRF